MIQFNAVSLFRDVSFYSRCQQICHENMMLDIFFMFSIRKKRFSIKKVVNSKTETWHAFWCTLLNQKWIENWKWQYLENIKWLDWILSSFLYIFYNKNERFVFSSRDTTLCNYDRVHESWSTIVSCHEMSWYESSRMLSSMAKIQRDTVIVSSNTIRVVFSLFTIIHSHYYDSIWRKHDGSSEFM